MAAPKSSTKMRRTVVSPRVPVGHCCRPPTCSIGPSLVLQDPRWYVKWRPTSHTSREPWPWNCESPRESVQKAIPTNLQRHVVWSRTLTCSVKSNVTGPSTKCYFNEFLTHEPGTVTMKLWEPRRKCSKCHPNKPLTPCSVVTDPHVQCEVTRDWALNRMLFQWVLIHASPHTW